MRVHREKREQGFIQKLNKIFKPTQIITGDMMEDTVENTTTTSPKIDKITIEKVIKPKS